MFYRIYIFMPNNLRKALVDVCFHLTTLLSQGHAASVSYIHIATYS